jgi:hypothetical protein
MQKKKNRLETKHPETRGKWENSIKINTTRQIVVTEDG